MNSIGILNKKNIRLIIFNLISLYYYYKSKDLKNYWSLFLKFLIKFFFIRKNVDKEGQGTTGELPLAKYVKILNLAKKNTELCLIIEEYFMRRRFQPARYLCLPAHELCPAGCKS